MRLLKIDRADGLGADGGWAKPLRRPLDTARGVEQKVYNECRVPFGLSTNSKGQMIYNPPPKDLEAPASKPTGNGEQKWPFAGARAFWIGQTGLLNVTLLRQDNDGNWFFESAGHPSKGSYPIGRYTKAAEVPQ